MASTFLEKLWEMFLAVRQCLAFQFYSNCRTPSAYRVCNRSEPMAFEYIPQYVDIDHSRLFHNTVSDSNNFIWCYLLGPQRFSGLFMHIQSGEVLSDKRSYSISPDPGVSWPGTFGYHSDRTHYLYKILTWQTGNVFLYSPYFALSSCATFGSMSALECRWIATLHGVVVVSGRLHVK